MVRRVFVFIHRWAGLLMTVFLILVGLTGSLLAFKTDVERLDLPAVLCDATTRRAAARHRHTRGARPDPGSARPGGDRFFMGTRPGVGCV